MSRWLVLPTLLLFAGPAAAQIPAPWDRPAGFGTFPHWHAPKAFRPTPVFVPYAVPVAYPVWGGYYRGAGFSTAVVPNDAPPPVPAGPPLDPAYLSSAIGRQRAAATAATVTTTTGVTVTLPGAGAVWLNGVRQPGAGPTFDLAVTTPRPGESVSVGITARWQAGGQTLEYERALTLASGDRPSLTVIRGTPTK